MTPSLQSLPVAGQSFAVVVDDVDGDGRLDLLTTNRAEGTAQVLYQKAPRQFEAGPATKVLGFHADLLMRLPGVTHRYVVNAEGDAALKVLAPDGQGGMREVAHRSQDQPFASTAFSWPGWGVSLAVVPYQGEILSLLRNFQPETAQADAEYTLGKLGQIVPGEVTAVDVDGDGVVELLYTTRRSRTLWRINYPGENKDPEMVPVWTVPVGAPRHLVVADVNGDAFPDILLPLESERRIAVLLNDGKGQFTPGPELPVPSRAWGPQRLAIAEDRDGALLLAASTEQSLMLYRIVKGKPYRYEMVELPLSASVNQILSLQDLDGDGEVDLLVALSKVQDSLQVIYGPLWETLVKPPRPEVSLVNDPARVVARVGNHDITVKDVREFVFRSGLGDELRTQAGQARVLKKVVEEVLLRKAVEQERTASGPLTGDEYVAGLKRVQDQHFPMPPSPEDTVLKAYYDAHQEDFGIPEMVRLVQIQFRTDYDQPNGPDAHQRAEQALQRLEVGEDFIKVATELTENPRARESGSGPDRGFVARGAETWSRDALRDLQPGQRTGVVASPAGYEILLLKDQRAPLVADFTAVRAKVATQWQLEQQAQARERYVQTLAKQFGVTILDKELEDANPIKQ